MNKPVFIRKQLDENGTVQHVEASLYRTAFDEEYVPLSEYEQLESVNRLVNEHISDLISKNEQLKSKLKVAVGALETASDYMDNQGQDATYLEIVIDTIRGSIK